MASRWRLILLVTTQGVAKTLIFGVPLAFWTLFFVLMRSSDFAMPPRLYSRPITAIDDDIFINEQNTLAEPTHSQTQSFLQDAFEADIPDAGQQRSAASVLVFSPHLDDALFSISGLLSTVSGPVRVVTVFAGSPLRRNEDGTSILTQWDKWGGFLSSKSAVLLRREEDLEAAAVLEEGSAAVPQMVHWGFLDAQYRRYSRGNEQRQLLVDNIYRRMVQEVVAATEALQRSKAGHNKILRVYGPFWNENIDHYDVRSAFLRLIGKMHSNKGVTFHVFEDLPYTLRDSVDLSNIAYEITVALKPLECRVSEVRVPLTEAKLELKASVIKAYGSQLRLFGDLLESIRFHTGKRCDVQYALCEVVWQLQDCFQENTTADISL